MQSSPTSMIHSFTASKTRIKEGDKIELQWEVESYQRLILKKGQSSMDVSNMKKVEVIPTTNSVYKLQACGNNFIESKLIKIDIFYPPKINSFRVYPDIIMEGKEVTLSWSVEDADALILNPGCINVSNQETFSLVPLKDTEFELFAQNGEYQSTQRARVTVKTYPKFEKIQDLGQLMIDFYSLSPYANLLKKMQKIKSNMSIHFFRLFILKRFYQLKRRYL